ncbi:Type I restriction-modification system methyltransferase subunit [Burkholderia pseudomallei]|uniref:hypothetical protein n=1 Tax=pseudomallei group TaxID=111527 RepID=UPI0001B41564|nr:MULTISPECIES: hypothetical protein [pseudomallei group]AHI72473.1 putative type I restriction-modification system methyltransferase subunit [Burkholderia thailandensis 2002721723]AIP26356.1 putative type I restriction-modification system methyltransferase subunit [Burkholderia thailandensis E264]AJX99364.1 putative adenine-specific DNA methylase [Burkholderia thailandensis 2002721643]NAX10181.1 hypothetical protein [Burkholderia pseudomallei]NAX99006.1 hypothetical protein [Burkholderia pse
MNLPSTHHTGPRFKLGRILATPAALKIIADARVSIIDLLIRHMRGDWGELSDSDRQQNELAVTTGQRILSNYALPGGRTVWLITEADRCATTCLLPGEY